MNVAIRPMRVLSLCSGVGMHDLGIGAAFDARTVCYVEREAFAAAQLVALFRAECLDEAPVWSDLATFDGQPWRGIVDCIVAGLPCQPYSAAGKRRGNDDHRAIGDGDGPIAHFLRVVSECQPAVVFLENVPGWVTRGWFRPVGEELCRLGYEIEEPLFLAAEDVGASHRRERVWIMATRPGGPGLQLARQAQVFSLPEDSTPAGQTSSETATSSVQRLNPAFTAWLLGLPWWWTNPGVTSSARLEMEAYRSALRLRLDFLLDGPSDD